MSCSRKQTARSLYKTQGCSVRALQAAGAAVFADLQAIRDTNHQNIQTSAQVLMLRLTCLCSSVTLAFLGSSIRHIHTDVLKSFRCFK